MSKVRFASAGEVRARTAALKGTRRRKMARSSHAFVRGSTIQFYEWLASTNAARLPDGPPVWICGDCHTGNLGPIGDTRDRLRVQIRDLDQTVIGNPAHDLVRLALSLASAARSSDLPGVTTARMLEAIMDGYDAAFSADFDEDRDIPVPSAVRVVMRRASQRTWKSLAKERIDDTRPKIPRGKRFLNLDRLETQEIIALFENPTIAGLATMVRSRDADASVEVLDAAYWVKGCSSLGRLRFAVLLAVTDNDDNTEHCLIDIKEATAAAAPTTRDAVMPIDDAERVVQGARHLSPYLGERMRGTQLSDRPVWLRELRPQDLKVELEGMTSPEATKAARYLASVVGAAHARQMGTATRAEWRGDLERGRTASLDAPSWLWTSVVDLLVGHEASYLEHCRRYDTDE